MSEVHEGVPSDLGLLRELSDVLCDAAAGDDGAFLSCIGIDGVSGLGLFLFLSIYYFLLEAAECGVIFSDKTLYLITSFNSII
ncbi:hypothetical protein ACQ86N_19120 [Puia sp. P3]|uniref:hypothetical protein n=1 Tax=Puia sp. P3 TaxID=3423952 RepID=UPI003D677459